MEIKKKLFTLAHFTQQQQQQQRNTFQYFSWFHSLALVSTSLSFFPVRIAVIFAVCLIIRVWPRSTNHRLHFPFPLSLSLHTPLGPVRLLVLPGFAFNCGLFFLRLPIACTLPHPSPPCLQSFCQLTDNCRAFVALRT